jgi:indolepyruvate ferredoxin oxidoreductase beta subunit
MVPPGQADFLVVLEQTQVEPTKHLLKEGGTLLLASSVDVPALATPKALNVAMLGMLSAFLDIPEASWLDAIRGAFPERLHEANVDALRQGRATGGKEKRNV